MGRLLTEEFICYLISLETLTHLYLINRPAIKPPGRLKSEQVSKGPRERRNQTDRDRPRLLRALFSLPAQIKMEGLSVCVCVRARHPTQTVLKNIKAHLLIYNNNFDYITDLELFLEYR